jgi:hypothetical protein
MDNLLQAVKNVASQVGLQSARGGVDDDTARRWTHSFYAQFGGITFIVMKDESPYVKMGDTLTVSTGGVVPEDITGPNSYVYLEHELGSEEQWEQFKITIPDQEKYFARKTVGRDQWQLQFIAENLSKGKYVIDDDHPDRIKREFIQFVESIEEQDDDDLEDSRIRRGRRLNSARGDIWLDSDDEVKALGNYAEGYAKALTDPEMVDAIKDAYGEAVGKLSDELMPPSKGDIGWSGLADVFYYILNRQTGGENGQLRRIKEFLKGELDVAKQIAKNPRKMFDEAGGIIKPRGE